MGSQAFGDRSQSMLDKIHKLPCPGFCSAEAAISVQRAPETLGTTQPLTRTEVEDAALHSSSALVNVTPTDSPVFRHYRGSKG